MKIERNEIDKLWQDFVVEEAKLIVRLFFLEFNTFNTTNNWTLYKGRSKNKTKTIYRVCDINNNQI